MLGAGFNIDNFLDCKMGGSFRVYIAHDGTATITVSTPGEPDETLHCASPGLANQAGLQLTAKGMTGYVASAR